MGSMQTIPPSDNIVFRHNFIFSRYFDQTKPIFRSVFYDIILGALYHQRAYINKL